MWAWFLLAVMLGASFGFIFGAFFASAMHAGKFMDHMDKHHPDWTEL